MIEAEIVSETLGLYPQRPQLVAEKNFLNTETHLDCYQSTVIEYLMLETLVVRCVSTNLWANNPTLIFPINLSFIQISQGNVSFSLHLLDAAFDLLNDARIFEVRIREVLL
jgi:hypothetical protein